MFLSVIVSCHNCKDSIEKVLRSILIQDTQDVEVIISDDQSTDGFMEVVKKFSKLLDIKHYKTRKHKYHCPGNTRLDGLSHATGDWVTFIDHDDAFMPNAFLVLKNSVATLDPELVDKVPYFFSPIQKISMTEEDEGILTATTWLHGNFYKRSFLTENKINFKEDLFGNEDLYFNNLVNGHLIGLGYSMMSSDQPLYKWYTNPNSLSNSRIEGSEIGYTEKYFADYLYANSIPHFDCAKVYPEKIKYFEHEMVKAIILAFFYRQRTDYDHPGHPIIEEMDASILKALKGSIKAFKWDVDTLIKLINADALEFHSLRSAVCTLSGPFIEKQSISDYLKEIFPR